MAKYSQPRRSEIPVRPARGRGRRRKRPCRIIRHRLLHREGYLKKIRPRASAAGAHKLKGDEIIRQVETRNEAQNASRSLNAFFVLLPFYGSAEDFTFLLLNFTPCEGVTPAAKQQIGETRN